MMRSVLAQSNSQPAYDDLALLAAQICGTSVGAITLFTEGDPVALAGLATPAFSNFVGSRDQTVEIRDVRLNNPGDLDPAVDQGGFRFCVGTPLPGPNGRAIGTLCVFDQIPRELTTEQRRGLEALARRAAAEVAHANRQEQIVSITSHLDEAQKLARVGSWSWDLVTNTITWSANMYRLFRADPTQTITFEHYMSHLSPADQVEGQRRFESALAGGESLPFEHECHFADGTSRTFVAQSVIEFDAQMRPLRMHGTSRDVTEERAEKFRLQALFDAMPIGFFVKDIKDDFRYLNVNQLAADLIGSTPAHCVGKTDFDLFSADEAELHRARDLETLALGEVRVFNDLMVEHRRLGLVPMRVRYFVIPDATGAPWILIGLSEDIRAEKEAHRLIEEQRASLVNSAKFSALGEMAGGLAHEINNPLAIIRGKATTLKRGLDKGAFDPERLRTELTKIESTSDRIAKIVSGLRMFSRNSEKDPRQATPLHEIITDTLELCHERMMQNGIKFTMDLGEPTDVLCRSTQISQILINLLQNAFDAIQDLPERWIRLEVEGSIDHVLVKITDCGAGIPAAVVEKMMMPFFTTKSIGKGTGLGLSISKALAEDNGGGLTYDAQSAHTRFVLQIARAVATDERRGA